MKFHLSKRAKILAKFSKLLIKRSNKYGPSRAACPKCGGETWPIPGGIGPSSDIWDTCPKCDLGKGAPTINSADKLDEFKSSGADLVRDMCAYLSNSLHETNDKYHWEVNHEPHSDTPLEANVVDKAQDQVAGFYVREFVALGPQIAGINIIMRAPEEVINAITNQELKNQFIARYSGYIIGGVFKADYKSDSSIIAAFKNLRAFINEMKKYYFSS